MRTACFWILLIIIPVSCQRKLADKEEKPVPGELPSCIREKIAVFGKLEEKNRPKFIMRYNWKGQTVYYIPARCCDIPSEVIGEDCKVICHPEGGITGKGDGICPGFRSEAKEGKVVWEAGE